MNTMTININFTGEQALSLHRILTPVAMGFMVGEFGQNDDDAKAVEGFITKLMDALVDTGI